MDEFEFEIILGILSIVVGIIAIILSLIALKKLTKGYLATYIQWVIYSISVFTLQAFWHTTREAFELKETMGAVIEYPEYILKIIAFSVIAYASYHLYKLSNVFGFKPKAENIRKTLNERKS